MRSSIRPSRPLSADCIRIKHPSFYLRSFDGSFTYPVAGREAIRFEDCRCVQCHELRIAAIGAAIERELGR